MKNKVKKLEVKKDERGWLAEILTPNDVNNKPFGLILITTAKPGQEKGKHYHKRKTEWYFVISGKGRLTLTDIVTGDKEEVVIEEDNMNVVEIPPNNFHEIKNIGETDMCLLVYVSEKFNPNDPDTYYERTQ